MSRQDRVLGPFIPKQLPSLGINPYLGNKSSRASVMRVGPRSFQLVAEAAAVEKEAPDHAATHARKRTKAGRWALGNAENSMKQDNENQQRRGPVRPRRLPHSITAAECFCNGLFLQARWAS